MADSSGDGVDFWGIFAQLKALDICDDAPVDLYGSGLADFYNRLVGDFISDIPVFERNLVPGAKVLDLASGAGRISVALARLGFSVDGLELSPDMLALAEARLADEPASVRALVRYHQGDMTDFALKERYDLILVGITSISLLLSEEARLALFACVRSHLAPGGRFVFDILNLGEDRWRALDNYYDVSSKETDEGTDVAIVGQRFFPDRRLFSFNVYRELIGWNGDTRRIIGNSVKAWLGHDQLADELTRGGLRIVEQFDEDAVIYFVTEDSSARPTGG